MSLLAPTAFVVNSRRKKKKYACKRQIIEHSGKIKYARGEVSKSAHNADPIYNETDGVEADVLINYVKNKHNGDYRYGYYCRRELVFCK